MILAIYMELMINSSISFASKDGKIMEAKGILMILVSVHNIFSQHQRCVLLLFSDLSCTESQKMQKTDMHHTCFMKSSFLCVLYGKPPISLKFKIFNFDEYLPHFT